MAPAVVWFRRDLRRADHPARRAAVEAGGRDGVVACFVVDDELCAPCGPARGAFLAACLDDLDAAAGGRLVLRSGRPEEVLGALAAEVGAESVFVTADAGPYGRRRDARVRRTLAAAGRQLVALDSPYAVAPGRVRTGSGTPYRVFTPFCRAWLAHGWEPPAPAPRPRWRRAEGDLVPADLPGRCGGRRPSWWGPLPAGPPPSLPEAGEEAAPRALDRFVRRRVAGYARDRDRPGEDATSRLSPDLHVGCLHPRQVLARLERPGGAGPEGFRTELAWPEFYADVLFHEPRSGRQTLQPGLVDLAWDAGADAEEKFSAWATGRTGYPMVDAAMHQLLAEGWVHNRARMVAASFLVKDLHLHGRWGARWFMYRLVDGDVASNQHGWQWTAGTGTDAAPFHRVFNPSTQAARFDPDGIYARRYLGVSAAPAGAERPSPELPAGGPAPPAPMVDHAAERREALRRFAEARRRRGAPGSPRPGRGAGR